MKTAVATHEFHNPDRRSAMARIRLALEAARTMRSPRREGR